MTLLDVGFKNISQYNKDDRSGTPFLSLSILIFKRKEGAR